MNFVYVSDNRKQYYMFRKKTNLFCADKVINISFQKADFELEKYQFGFRLISSLLMK